ncbi:MAG TPA: hypothetical protein VNC61_15035 [Acidimicrobiales bacterium]|nr:hypothetical protein [Acidimicrobiales bacterium]
MSKIKKMSRGGWIVIGILIAMMMVPSGVAVAKALHFTGIEGTSTNKADVSAAGQLLTTQADAGASYTRWTPGITTPRSLAVIPAGDALIITSIHIDNISGTTGGVAFGIANNGCTSGATFDSVNFASNGITVLPYEPGVPVPAGDEVCAFPGGGWIGAATVTGYFVPAAAG